MTLYWIVSLDVMQLTSNGCKRNNEGIIRRSLPSLLLITLFILSLAKSGLLVPSWILLKLYTHVVPRFVTKGRFDITKHLLRFQVYPNIKYTLYDLLLSFLSPFFFGISLFLLFLIIISIIFIRDIFVFNLVDVINFISYILMF